MSIDTNLPEKIQKTVDEWFKYDKDPKTIAEIRTLVEKGDLDALEKRLGSCLSFGTSGLRAPVGAGNSCMNILTVLQATQGLYTYLNEAFHDELYQLGVVIGYDHRHGSLDFANIASSVFLAKDVPVYLFRRVVMTPIVSFACKSLPVFCGIMITASHNPKADNGYKVYWGYGGQICPPHDSYIAKAIDANRVPWSNIIYENVSQKTLDPTEKIIELYFKSLASLKAPNFTSPKCQNKLVYTPMHGVGQYFAERAFKEMGFPDFVGVPRQMNPDPEFSTVEFPNPEEFGAFDESIKVAEEAGLKFVLSNDPDADRFALAEKRNDSQWKIFNGDEIAIILAYYLMENVYKDQSGPFAFLCSFVSSPLLGHYCKALQKKHPDKTFHFEESPTGFKYLSSKTNELLKKGYVPVLVYEEALGYMTGSAVIDKDGISAAVTAAQLIYSLKDSESVYGYLNHIYRDIGYVPTYNSYFMSTDKSQINGSFFKLRHGRFLGADEDSSAVVPPKDISSLLPPVKSAVVSISDNGKDLVYVFQDSLKITIRGSGTEPKLKFYSHYPPCEIPSDCSEEALEQIKTQAQNKLYENVNEVCRKWLEPEIIGIKPSNTMKNYTVVQ